MWPPRLPSTSRSWPYLLIAFVVKAICVAFFTHELAIDALPGSWAVTMGDTGSYFDPIDRLLQSASYSPDLRMPGYGALYLLLRLLFDPAHAAELMIVAQVVLGSFAIVALARIAERCTGTSRAFVITFVLGLACMFTGLYDALLGAESFCASAIIFHARSLIRHIDTRSRASLVCAGAWLAWAVFLRPVYAPLFLFGSCIVVFHERAGWRVRLSHVMFFLLPFALLDGAWTVRNERAHHEFRPLSNGFLYPEYMSSVRYPVQAFVEAYGGDINQWRARSDERWFNVLPRYDRSDPAEIAPAPPDFAYADGYNEDSLRAVAVLVKKALTGLLPAEEQARTEREVFARLARYQALYQKGRPFQYHVMSRVRAMRIYLVHSGTEGMFMSKFKEMSVPMKCFKLLQVIVYAGSLLFTLIALLRWCVRPRGNAALAVVILLFLYGLLIYPIAFRLTVPRYLVPVFPFAILLASVVIAGFGRRGSRTA